MSEKETAKRLLTNTEQPQMLQFFKMRGKSVEVLSYYINEMVRYLQNVHKIKFKEFIADFINGKQAPLNEKSEPAPQPTSPQTTDNDAAAVDTTTITQSVAPTKKQDLTFAERLSKPIERPAAVNDEIWWFVQVKGIVLDDTKRPKTAPVVQHMDGDEFAIARPISAVCLPNVPCFFIYLFFAEGKKQGGLYQVERM